MSTFYAAGKSLERVTALVERYGPGMWHDTARNAEHYALPGEKVYKVTIDVTEDE